MVAINHCRKCGSVPELIKVGDYKEYFIVKCPKCHYTEANYDEASTTEQGVENDSQPLMYYL